ncbi:OmpA family protein [Arcticibacter eurypsychrophilus]|uniref:OmpA family protein n=1 Tax=Arcticibacter eurypsychrophilus TaxID=1434752 RepID=UPI00084D4BA9|nr:OmpA family protein [Arcticibacter eurypsychrophilus]
MKFLKTHLLPGMIILLGLSSLQACKTKKAGMATNPYGVAKEEPVAVKETPAAVEQKKDEEVMPPVKKPDFNFSNIQFEFNSVVLRTISYPILDKAATEMKKDSAVRFVINGHSSAEGSEAHNMALSRDRAYSVKTYLENAGISGSNLEVKGYGEAEPIQPDATEQGRVANRRVEIEIIP